MKKAIVYGPRDVRLDDVDDPIPGDREVVVRVVRSSMCHTDVKVYLGEMAHLGFPRGIGHDSSGVVELVGPGVVKVKAGDRVTMVSWGGCGECRMCRRGQTNACRNRPGGGRETAWFADKVLKPEREIVPLPANVTFEQAAFLEPLYTGLNGRELLGYGDGDTVVVVGTGSMGWGQIQVAAMTGARVVGIDLMQERLALARHFGASETFLADDPDLDAKVWGLIGADGPDYAIDATGNAPGLELAMRLAGYGARVGTLGIAQAAELRPIVTKQLSVHAIRNGPQKPLAVKLIAEGKLGLTDAITQYYPFGEVAAALAFAADHPAAASKVMLTHE